MSKDEAERDSPEKHKEISVKDWVESQKRPWWRTYALLTLLGAGAIWYSLPFLDRHAAQEECTFGTGSTDLYDRLRGEAEAYLSKHGRVRLSNYSPESARKFADEVLDQLRNFAMSRPTATQRWAAIHALLRVYGMDFDSNSPRDKEDLKPETVQLSARYIVLLPKLNLLCPLCYVFREAALILQVTNRGDGVYDQIKGGLWITDLNPKSAPVYRQRFNQICPQVLK